MATKITPALSVVVETVPGYSLRFVTNVTVNLTDIEVAKATFGGRWSQAAALKEFSKAPHRFAKCYPGYDMARSFGLVG